MTFIAANGDDQEAIEIRYEDENIWLTQKMMAALYDVSVATINEHLKKIYADSELQEEATIRNFLIVQKEGSRNVSRETKHYNLQAIIARHIPMTMEDWEKRLNGFLQLWDKEIQPL